MVATLGVAVLCGATRSFAQNECLAKVRAANRSVTDESTVCREADAETRSCFIELQVCLNQSDGGCTAGPMKRKVKARGSCKGIGKLRAKPDGSNAVCGSAVEIRVKTKKKGRREGKCKFIVAAKSTDKPARRDVDKVTLVCKPNPGECPVTVRVGPTTTTTLPCLPPCECCVQPLGDLLRCLSQ